MLTRRSFLTAFAASAASADPPRYREHQDLTYYLDTSGQRRAIKSREDWQRRRAHVLAGMQEVMGRLPGREKRVRLEVKVEEEVTVGDLRRRRITFGTSPGQRVAAYLFLPPGEGRRRAALCLHPTGELGKGIVSGLGGKAHRQYALELAQRGWVTLAPDYPTFGDYKIANPSGDGWESGTMRAIWDNMRAVDLLHTLPQVDPGRIAAIGHSLGGHNSIFSAVLEPRIGAVVSSCGFTRFHRYYGGKLAGWTSPRYMPKIASERGNDPDRMPFDFPELIAALAPRPFFTNSPLHDANFDVDGAHDCIAAARPIYELYGHSERLQAVYPDCEHDFPDAVRERAYAFLERHLG